ncbi:hypothetical protein [Aliiglaciecola litoralis]
MRWILLCLMIVAAIGCYLIGSATGMVVLIILGVCIELAFWIGILNTKRKKTENNV